MIPIPKEAILTGVPQFIIASITFLTTTAQARYLLDLEQKTKDRIKTEIEKKTINKKHKDEEITKFIRNWHLLLFAWWILTPTAIVTLILRIFPSIFIDDCDEKFHTWFIWLDLAIIIGTFVGYSLLALAAYNAWDWNKWQGVSRNGKQ